MAAKLAFQSHLHFLAANMDPSMSDSTKKKRIRKKKTSTTEGTSTTLHSSHKTPKLAPSCENHVDCSLLTDFDLEGGNQVDIELSSSAPSDTPTKNGQEATKKRRREGEDDPSASAASPPVKKFKTASGERHVSEGTKKEDIVVK